MVSSKPIYFHRNLQKTELQPKVLSGELRLRPTSPGRTVCGVGFASSHSTSCFLPLCPKIAGAPPALSSHDVRRAPRFLGEFFQNPIASSCSPRRYLYLPSFRFKFHPPRAENRAFSCLLFVVLLRSITPQPLIPCLQLHHRWVRIAAFYAVLTSLFAEHRPKWCAPVRPPSSPFFASLPSHGAES